MFKTISLTVLLTIISYASTFCQTLGQKVLLEQEIKLKGSGACYFVPNEDNSSLLIIDSKLIRIIDLNKNEITKTYPHKELHKKEIIGHATSEGITLFYSTWQDEMNYTYLDPQKSDVRTGVLNYATPQDEYYLSSFSGGDSFYILTVTKESSILNFYIFSSFYASEKKSVDLSSSFRSDPLSEQLKKTTTTPGTLDLGKKPYLSLVDSYVDIGISSTNDLNKLYAYPEKILITLDASSSQTKMINISLKDFTFNLKFFSQSGSCFSSSIYSVNNSNSFVNGENIYTARACKEEILFGIFNLDGTVIERIRISSDGIETQNERNFYILNPEDSKKTMRIMSKLDVGLVAQEDDSTLLLTIGGYKAYSNIGGGGFGGPPISMSQTRTATFQGILSLHETSKELKIDNSKYYKVGVRKRGLENSFARFIQTFEYNDIIYICHYNNYKKIFMIESF